LRCKQIRYCKDIDNHGEIIFHEMSNSDVDGYDYLYGKERQLFMESLKEDLKEFDGIEIDIDKIVEIENV